MSGWGRERGNCNSPGRISGSRLGMITVDKPDDREGNKLPQWETRSRANKAETGVAPPPPGLHLLADPGSRSSLCLQGRGGEIRSFAALPDTAFVTCPRNPRGFPGGSVVKNPPAKAGEVGLISGSGRSPGEGNGNPLQYPCLRDLMDRGTWWAIAQWVAKNWTRLGN